MVHTIQFFSGVYFTDPTEVLNFGESASLGTGIMISTLLAVDLLLNWDLALTMYSTRLCACLSITDSIQIKGFTWRSKYLRSIFYYSCFAPVHGNKSHNNKTKTSTSKQYKAVWRGNFDYPVMSCNRIKHLTMEKTYVCVQPIWHEFKLPIRGNKWNCAVVLKPDKEKKTS